MALDTPPRGTPTGTPDQPPIRNAAINDLLHEFRPVRRVGPVQPWRNTEDLAELARARGFSAAEIDVTTHIYEEKRRRCKRLAQPPGDEPIGREVTPKVDSGSPHVPVPDPVYQLHDLLEGLKPPASAGNFSVPRSVVMEARRLVASIAKDAAHREEMSRVQKYLEEMTRQLRTLLGDTDAGSLPAAAMQREHGGLWVDDTQSKPVRDHQPQPQMAPTLPPSPPASTRPSLPPPSPLPMSTTQQPDRLPACMPDRTPAPPPCDDTGTSCAHSCHPPPVPDSRPTRTWPTRPANRPPAPTPRSDAGPLLTLPQPACSEEQVRTWSRPASAPPALHWPHTHYEPPMGLPAGGLNTRMNTNSRRNLQPRTALPVRAQGGADTTAQIATDSPVQPHARARRLRKNHTTRRRSWEERHARLVMRFAGDPPDIAQRMSPLEMRDRINRALAHTKARVRGVTFTRAGNIAIIPLAPSTAAEIARYHDTFEGHVAHGRPTDSLVFEMDGPWPSIVAHNVCVTTGQETADIWEVEHMLCKELGGWNPCLQEGAVKDVRVLCRAEDIMAEPRRAIRISFTSDEWCQRALREGICAYGEQLRLSAYRSAGWKGKMRVRSSTASGC
jgi:hypothetical protein